MPIIARNTGGSFEPAPQGTFPARCYRLIHVGTVAGTYAGKPTRRSVVQIGWELPTQLMTDGRPFVIDQIYTLSLSPKSNLRPLLVGWRGRDFTDDEAANFNMEAIVGHACMLSIIHTHNETGDVRAKVQGAFPLPQGTQISDAVNAREVFDVDLPDMDVFNKLSDFMQSMIRSSEQWQQRTADLNAMQRQSTPIAGPLQGAAGPAQQAPAPQVPAAPMTATQGLPTEFDDDIPW